MMASLSASLCLLLGAVNPDSAWSALRQRYIGLASLSGRFTETIESSAESDVQTFDGRFWIRLPDDYRLEVETPERQLIVGNDSVLWIHLPDERRAVRQSHGQAVPILAFLDPLLNPEASAKLLPDAANRIRLAVIQLDTIMATMFDLVFQLDESATNIERFWFRDAWDGSYALRFSAQTWNPQLDDSLFRFHPPSGTEIEGNDAGP